MFLCFLQHFVVIFITLNSKFGIVCNTTIKDDVQGRVTCNETFEFEKVNYANVNTLKIRLTITIKIEAT